MKKQLLTAVLAAIMCLQTVPAANAVARQLSPFENIVGDVNFDGVIDAADATEALQEYSAQSVGKSFFKDDQDKISVADFNFDNKIDASDATSILQTYSYNSTNDTPLRPRTSYYIVEFTLGKKTTGDFCKTYEEALAWSKPYLPPPVLQKQYRIVIKRFGMCYEDEVGNSYLSYETIIYDYKTEFYGIL